MWDFGDKIRLRGAMQARVALTVGESGSLLNETRVHTKKISGRILFLSYEYPPLGGGGAKVVQGLIAKLLEAGWQIDLVTMGFRGLPRYEKKGNLQIHRIPCIRLKTSMCFFPEMIPYLLLAIPKVFRLMREHHYDVNHTHFIFPDGVIAWFVRHWSKTPYVITAHGSDVPGYNPNRFKLLHRLLLPLWKRVAQGAAKIICPSESIKRLILKNDPAVSTDVIPNGIELGKFKYRAEKEKRILVVTRMFERKGVQYFLQALAGLNLRDFAVDIVGEGPFLPALRKMASEKNLPVTFWGFLDNKGPELRRLYETSSIFVFTSEAENFPIVLLEAMVAGMAIITTQGTGCAEVVGEAALLVAPRDPEGIRQNLEALIDDPALCLHLGMEARSRAVQNFSWEKILDHHTNVYADVSKSRF